MTASAASCSALQLHLLLAPHGQLSADGQLGELIRERRSRLGGDGGILYLSPELLVAQQLASGDQEAVAAQDPAVITWLQLRFGGRRQSWQLAVASLPDGSLELPPAVVLPW
ncbi:MAG: hypothetical protein WCQ20_01275 [Synechococcaceae cyanobacterium ELA739]